MLLTNKKNHRSRMLVSVLAVVFLLYSLVGFVIVPAVAKSEALAFVEQRLGGRAQIDAIRFNPFTFVATISALKLSDANDEALASFDSLSVNYQPSGLLSGEIAFASIVIDGFYVNLQRYPDGSNNIAALVQRWNASAQPPNDTGQGSAEGEPLAFRIDALRVTGASVGVIDEAVTPTFNTLIESIDFTLDDLSTVADTAAQQRLTLAIGEGSQLRWTGELSLVPVHSKGELQLFGPLPKLAYRYFQNQLPIVLEHGWFDASLLYELALSDAGEIDLRVQEIGASLSNLNLREKQTGNMLLRLPELSVQGASLDLLQRQIAVQRVLMDRVQVNARRSRDGVVNLQQIFVGGEQGNAEAMQSATASADAAPWEFRLAQLALDDWQIGVRDLQPEQALDVSVGLSATAANISNIQNQLVELSTDLTLSSGGSLTVLGELTVTPEINFVGDIALEALALPLIQPYLASIAHIQLSSGVLNVSGELTANPRQSEFNGDASLDDLLIRDALENEDLFSLSSLGFEDSIVSVGEVTLIEIAGIEVQAPYARIEIEEDGSNNISRVLIASTDSEEQEVAQEQNDVTNTASALPAVRIERVLLEQGSADFSDRSLPLPFAVHIEGLGGEVSALSSRSNEPARITLEGQVDEYGLASITGRMRPLDYAALTQIDLSFRNLNIPAMSPYVIKFAGRRIDDGALDVDLIYRINEGQLDGQNAMVMRDLVLGERIAHPDAMDLPLGLAIALLKDSNGVIDLDVPVTGDLASPEFNYGNVIRTALGNIIRNIVASPFRFLANLVGSGEDSNIGVIEFVPGRADLQPPQREKLVQLADALMQRPQLQLGLLGRYSTLADTQVLKEKFFDERFNAALALEQNSELSPALVRLQLLEQLTMAQAEQGAGIELQLLALRQEYTRVDSANLEQFDDIAYAQALRRDLIAQQPVSDSDLQRLAAARVEAITVALTAIDASLASRLQTHSATEDVAVNAGRIPFALELSAM